jgi:hypothetical protein
MGAELGRISGPLLANNLKRNGVNLAFEDQLVYFNVVTGRVGINSSSPATDLYVSSDTHGTDLIVDTLTTIGDFEISNSEIQHTLSSIQLNPDQTSNPTIVTPGLSTDNLYFHGNTITDTSVADDDINIDPAGTGKINLNNNTLVSGDLHATGDVTWDGDITFGDNLSNDTVTFDAEVGSDIIPSSNNTDNLGSDTLNQYWGTTYVDTATPTTLSTGSLTVGTLLNPGTLTASGTNLLNGNVIFGTTVSNTLTVNSEVVSDLVPVDNTVNLGTSSYYWNTAYTDSLDNQTILFHNNTVSVPYSTDTSLQLSANGSGKVYFDSVNVIDNNATVGNTLQVIGTTSLVDTNVGDITQTGDFNQIGLSNTHVTGTVRALGVSVTTPGYYLDIGNFQLLNQTISGTITDSTVYYTANGSGSVNVENLQFSNNNIKNIKVGAATDLQKSVILTPNGLGNVEIDSTKSLILPIGNNSTKTLSANGQIRFNSTTKNIEGYNNTGYVNFINLYSQDQKTYITPELTRNAGDNTLRLSVNNVVTTTVTPTALTSTTLQAGNVKFNSNDITNANTANDITFGVTGLGKVLFNGIQYADNNNFYTSTNSGITFATTNHGYVKFAGTNGLAVPYGDASTYPASPQIGTIRQNTDTSLLEVYNGVTWYPAYNPASILNIEEVQNLIEVYTILLGF